MTHEHAEHIAALADLSPQELMALHAEARNRQLHEAELTKDHPLARFALPAAEWSAFKEHLMDGGGVADDHDLARDLFQSLFDDDQKTFWPAVAHLIKARAKIHGHVRALKSGGVSMTGIGVGGKR
jgi:hypothetical protein